MLNISSVNDRVVNLVSLMTKSGCCYKADRNCSDIVRNRVSNTVAIVMVQTTRQFWTAKRFCCV